MKTKRGVGRRDKVFRKKENKNKGVAGEAAAQEKPKPASRAADPTAEAHEEEARGGWRYLRPRESRIPGCRAADPRYRREN
jgi:hypothetical protein